MKEKSFKYGETLTNFEGFLSFSNKFEPFYHRHDIKFS